MNRSEREAAQRQAEVQRRRNETSLRVALIDNGYLVTRLGSGATRACLSREDMHRVVDEFFDEVEALAQADRVLLESTAQLPDDAWRKTSTVVEPAGRRARA